MWSRSTERAIASEEGNAKGEVRKTTEAAAAGGADSDGDGERGEKGGGGNDEFFANLMAKMNGEDAMGMPESSGLGSEADPAAGESAPMSIFEFASMRYRRAANEENRLRPLPSKKAEAAMR